MQTIVKKVSYALVSFNKDGYPKQVKLYGKAQMSKQIKTIKEQYNLSDDIEIDIKLITEKRMITLEDFLQNSIIVNN